MLRRSSSESAIRNSLLQQERHTGTISLRLELISVHFMVLTEDSLAELPRSHASMGRGNGRAHE